LDRFIGGRSGSALRHSENGASTAQALDPKSTALPLIGLDYKWRKEGFDDVMEADFTVKNGSSYDIKDIEITCHHFGKSGTEIDSNTRTIFDVVKAHSTKKFLKFNMGLIHTQAARSSCAITNLGIAP
jgi:hypothetical protein